MNRNFSIHSSAPLYPRGASAVPASRPSRVPTAGTVEIPSRRPVAPGKSQLAGALGANDTRANLIPLPPRSIVDPGSASLETPDLGYAVLDVFVAGITGIGFFVALFLLFFCQF